MGPPRRARKHKRQRAKLNSDSLRLFINTLDSALSPLSFRRFHVKTGTALTSVHEKRESHRSATCLPRQDNRHSSRR